MTDKYQENRIVCHETHDNITSPAKYMSVNACYKQGSLYLQQDTEVLTKWVVARLRAIAFRCSVLTSHTAENVLTRPIYQDAISFRPSRIVCLSLLGVSRTEDISKDCW